MSGGGFDPYTGREVGLGSNPSDHSPAVLLGLEPPRYCADCGRRLVVQVLPNGWHSTCSRHGDIDSSSLGRR